jgi:hypothetical protein
MPSKPTRPPAAAVSGRVARCAAGAGAALARGLLAAGTAHAAHAAEDGDIRVSPRQVTPGGTVGLDAVCGRHATAMIDASTLHVGTLTLVVRDRARPEAVHGELRVPAGTAPGDYGIGGECSDGRDISGTLTVTAAPAPQADLAKAPVAPRMPSGGVAAGAGGAARTAARPGETAVGAAVLGIGLAGAFLTRRRNAAAPPR